MNIIWLMQQFAGKWPEGRKSSKFPSTNHWFKLDIMKGQPMSTSAEQHQVPDRNGLVRQGLIGDHMVRVTVEPTCPSPPVYRVTIGLFHKYGNTLMNPRHCEWTSRHKFSHPLRAWVYGKSLTKGATNKARND